MSENPDPNAPAPVPVKKYYKLDPSSGAITRQVGEDGEPVHICTLNGTVLEWQSDDFRLSFSAPVKRRISEWAVQGVCSNPTSIKIANTSMELPVAPSEAPEEPVAAAPKKADKKPDDPNDPLYGLTIDQRKAVFYLREREGFPRELERPAPKRPVLDQRGQRIVTGDKHELVVNWFLRYHPKEFVRRYGVIGVGKVETRETTIDKLTSKRFTTISHPEGVVATRKTHLTLTDRNATAGRRSNVQLNEYGDPE